MNESFLTLQPTLPYYPFPYACCSPSAFCSHSIDRYALPHPHYPALPSLPLPHPCIQSNTHYPFPLSVQSAVDPCCSVIAVIALLFTHYHFTPFWKPAHANYRKNNSGWTTDMLMEETLIVLTSFILFYNTIDGRSTEREHSLR